MRSRDDGVTWAKVTTVPGGITDLAFDPAHGRCWIVSQDVLECREDGTLRTVVTPVDRYGSVRVASVAVDPVDSEIVYVGNHKDLYACNNSVVHSMDSGGTWKIRGQPAVE